ncbi:MAG: alpha/beta fold hydrolase, partial [Pseudonocardiaceae bacterium]
VSPTEFAEVIAAKVAGALHLDSLLADHPLEAFVLMSSVAGVWGSGGQVAYAAANAFLDGLAHQRRTRGVVATAVAWGPWAQDGMAADPTISKHLLQRGLPAMTAPIATTALWQAVAEGVPALTVADVDWQRCLPTFAAARTSRLFEDIPETDPAARQTDAGTDQASAPWLHRLAGTSVSERDSALVELVRVEAADILGHATAQDVDVACPFFELGFDSLAAVELRKRLIRTLGRSLSTTVVFVHPTVIALASHLATELPDDATHAGSEGGTGQISTTHIALHDPEPETVRVLYRRACQLDMLDTGLELLVTATKLRPVFHSAAELGTHRELVRLAQGPIAPALVCVPPFVAPSGTHNYARLAMNLHDLRDVYALSHPGFGDREPLPATLELIVAMHAEAVHQHLGDTPFAMVGYSSGGWFAHAITAHLETLGVFPTAVVLLDSLAIRDDAWDHVRSPLKTMALNDQAFA